MACDKLKQKIYNTLKSGAFSGSNYFINVFDDRDDQVRILVISRKFDIYQYKSSEREERVLSEIKKELSDDETQQISRIVAVNPEEIKVYS